MAPLLGHLLQWSELLTPEASGPMLQAVLEQQIARRTFDDCSLALLSRRGQRLGQWERLTPRQQARILGIATQDRNRRRHALRWLRSQFGRTG